MMNASGPDLEERLITLATALAQNLPPQDVEFAESLTRAGEYGVALEHLANQIDEFDIEVAPEIYQEILCLGTAMELDEDYWTSLKVTRK